jgi:hypothetical protein
MTITKMLPDTITLLETIIMQQDNIKTQQGTITLQETIIVT